jgi:hypothetical protein
LDGPLRPGSVVFVEIPEGVMHRGYVTHAWTENPVKEVLVKMAATPGFTWLRLDQWLSCEGRRITLSDCGSRIQREDERDNCSDVIPFWLEFWYLLGEAVKARKPLVLFLGEAAIRDAFRDSRLRIWLRRENRIIAIQSSLAAVLDFKTGLQPLGNRLILARSRGWSRFARFDLDERLSSDRRRASLSNCRP